LFAVFVLRHLVILSSFGFRNSAQPMLLRLILLFLLGACLGAVVNLCVYRLAYLRRRISPWGFMRGQLPARGWLDVVPILGWIGLRREEKFHGKHFWLRPLAIELGFGLLAAGLYWFEADRLALIRPPLPMIFPMFGQHVVQMLHAQYAVHLLLFVFMAIATFIDIDEQTVPDAVTVPGTLIALAIAALCPASTLPALFINQNVPQGAALWAQLVDPLRFNYLENADAFLNSAVSLVIGVTIYLLWCFALLPRRWRLGVGVGKAWRVMWRRISAQNDWKWVLPVALGGVIGIVAAWKSDGAAWHGLFSALVGMAVGGGMIWAIRLIGGAALNREAMGFGDVTLMAMIGAFIGWQPAILVFFLAPFAGAVVGITQLVFHRENVIPYGPFLCLATFVVIVFWSPIWNHANQYFAIPWLIPSAILVCLPLLAVLLLLWMRVKQRMVGEG
jgi:leader peptidase (prepilin peptidase) / N-methyltransferase